MSDRALRAPRVTSAGVGDVIGAGDTPTPGAGDARRGRGLHSPHARGSRRRRPPRPEAVPPLLPVAAPCVTSGQKGAWAEVSEEHRDGGAGTVLPPPPHHRDGLVGRGGGGAGSGGGEGDDDSHRDPTEPHRYLRRDSKDPIYPHGDPVVPQSPVETREGRRRAAGPYRPL